MKQEPTAIWFSFGENQMAVFILLALVIIAVTAAEEEARLRQSKDSVREQVRQNFLLTRHIRDYLLLFLSLFHSNKGVIHL